MTDAERIEALEKRVEEIEHYIEALEALSAQAVARFDETVGR